MEIENFEWDDAKDLINQAKHGISFLEATELWDGPSALDILTDFGTEVRNIRIGRLNQRCWVAVYTHRGSRIRLISVRRARLKEEQRYDHERHRFT